jgi:hypothetical protein
MARAIAVDVASDARYRFMSFVQISDLGLDPGGQQYVSGSVVERQAGMVAISGAENSLDDSVPAASGPRRAVVVDSESADVVAWAADGELSKPTVRADRSDAGAPQRRCRGGWSRGRGLEGGQLC